MNLQSGAYCQVAGAQDVAVAGASGAHGLPDRREIGGWLYLRGITTGKPVPSAFITTTDVPMMSAPASFVSSGDHVTGEQNALPASSGWSPHWPLNAGPRRIASDVSPRSASSTVITWIPSCQNAIREPSGDHDGQNPAPIA